MTWDIITSLSLVVSIFMIWVQRKTIFQLENELFEIEQAYRKSVGKFYRYKYKNESSTSKETL